MTDTYTPVLTDEQVAAFAAKQLFSLMAACDQVRAIERAAIEAYQRQQKERFRSLVYTASPLIEAAAAEGKRVAETPHGPVFFSYVGDDPACPDEPDDWQPIETAPHDETVLLGWRVDDAAWMVEVGMASWGWRNEHVSNISKHGRATHWMPLPPPPEIES